MSCLGQIQLFFERHYFTSFKDFMAKLYQLARMGFLGISVLGYFTHEEWEELRGQYDKLNAAKKLDYLDFVNISPGGSVYAAINRQTGIHNTASEYLLFYSSQATLLGNCFEQMFHALENSKNLAGINPLFVYGDYPDRVAHMGTVADFQGLMHFLYEGISVDNPLARKRRAFQIPLKEIFLMRKKDFMAAGGFPEDGSPLEFMRLCSRISQKGAKFYTTEPMALAALANPWLGWDECGLYNSLLQKQRISAGLLKSDYARNIENDNLEYGVDEWLNEGPLNLDYNASGRMAAWLDWRHWPQPFHLLQWLAHLSPPEINEAMRLARIWPCYLPHSFVWYQDLAEKLNAGALLSKNDILRNWHKRARIFNYSSLRKGMRLLLEMGIYNCSLDACPNIYDAWLELSEKSTFSNIEPGLDWPKIAVVMPVYNPDPVFLKEAITSARQQDYQNWELCIADDMSCDYAIKEILRSTGQEDKRVKIVFRQENGHISLATNSALELVKAPWTAFLDHDDCMPPYALKVLADFLANNPHIKYVFSDEDHIRDNIRFGPVFRHAFDPVSPFVGHLSCYATSLLRKLNGLRIGTEGAQDTDLAYRAGDILSESEIAHIPHILYHWRKHEGSTSSSLQTKPYVLEATRKTLLDKIYRRGWAGKLFHHKGLYYKIYLHINNLENCAAVIMAENGHINTQVKDCMRNMSREFSLPIYIQPYARHVTCKHNFTCLEAAPNFNEAILMAARHVKYKYILFIHGSVIPLADNHLEQLFAYARFENAAVTGTLIWLNSILWHGGLYPDITGLPFPLLRGTTNDNLSHCCWSRFLLPRKVLGVSWLCAVIDRELLMTEYGLNAEMAQYAEVDFSLAQERNGYKTVICQWGQCDLAGAPVEKDNGQDYFLNKWGDVIKNHGLRNANLRGAPDNDWTTIFS